MIDFKRVTQLKPVGQIDWYEQVLLAEEPRAGTHCDKRTTTDGLQDILGTHWGYIAAQTPMKGEP